jgi:hypothetical protein
MNQLGSLASDDFVSAVAVVAVASILGVAVVGIAVAIGAIVVVVVAVVPVSTVPVSAVAVVAIFIARRVIISLHEKDAIFVGWVSERETTHWTLIRDTI